MDTFLKQQLSIGDTLTQSEVEDTFNTNFGFQFKGITLRSPDEGRYIILMSNEGEIYNDQVGDGDEFIYEGEGEPEKGDQEAISPNTDLMNAIKEPLPIYFFTSEEGLDEYEYRGLVDVNDYSYVSDGERMVYRFQMEELSVSKWKEFQEAEKEVERAAEGPPTIRDDEKYETSRSKVRSATFSRKVRKRHDYACSVCGVRRFSPEGNPEIEAAHVYPKAEGGSDDPRNGIPLCRTHHWAFDCGWFSVDDDLEVVVKDTEETDQPEAVVSLRGEQLLSATQGGESPHSDFLVRHRKLHGFE